MAKALDQELVYYMFQLDEAEKKSVLQMLKTFVKGREKSVDRITIEQYNKEIDEAIARVEAGDFFTHDDVEKMSKGWQMVVRKIVWDKQAINYFRASISYIRKESPQNADKIKKEILKKISELSKRPEIHPPDKYKSNNSGQFKAFELYRFRIAYMVKEDEVIISRIRNTNQEPLEYQQKYT